ncbi:hypothetical protein P691DRAFT_677598 [Macrolepiota fuliginosa MF-IS2]|uniref:Peptidase M48 domain-containing protein n=1 Tax=Macrolepiota fuliginosa MF-IS2 TaxID=1400762 RepID=A0A9P5X4R3_9AGAR|nr:hypothetical protein P691DRAFT_677598 [Macrolepiota fuliginosa MF-IS2]
MSRSTFPRHFHPTTLKHKQYIRFSDSPHNGGKRHHPLDWRQWDRWKVGASVVALGGVYYVTHLEQVPETGRWRFMNMSSQSEEKFGEVSRNELKQGLAGKTLPPEHPLSIHVRRVASRILKHSNLGYVRGETRTIPEPSIGFDNEVWTPSDDYGASVRNTYGPEKEWDVIVVNDNKVINAMASPGVILVFTGLLPICQDEQGLAAVLSHEIGHVVARHMTERISSQFLYLAFYAAIQLVLGIDWNISRLFKTYLLELPNTRTQEYEADLIGLRLMSRACYDPVAAPQMFERLGRVEAKLGSRAGNDFFYTHPSSEHRTKKLEEVLPEAYAILAANPECATMRDQLEQFREQSREIRVTGQGGIEFV